MESVGSAPAVQVARESPAPVAAPMAELAPTLLPFDAASVLALQRSAGNRKVTALLQTARPTLARDTLPALSSSELMDFMLSQRGFSSSKPGMPAVDPKGVGKPSGQGYATFAAVQVVDADGNQIKVG